jgi:glucose/arabinose dehydrogenase
MLAVAPNGNLFVSDTRTGKVYVMPDRDNNGIADSSDIFAEDLNKPHGLAFHKGHLYVATEDAMLRFPYSDGRLRAEGPPQKVVDLPAGPGSGLAKDVNHDTRSVVFAFDKMYVSAGSSCDLCEEPDPRRAAILRFNDDGSNEQVFASGLRNAVGLDVDPRTGFLWASVNERNEKGDDIPPDLLTTILDRADYGWPYCSGVPLRPDPQFGKSEEFCSSKQSAAVALPAHTAPLGIRFYNGGGQLPEGYDYGIFLAMHGSVVRSEPVGYDVRFVSLRPGKTAQGAQVAISGWLVNGQPWGRPVDIAFGKDGAMFISDDFAGAVYRVTFGQN